MSEMKKYMLLLGGSGEEFAAMPDEVRDAHMGDWNTWFEDLGKEGILLGGAPFAQESVIVKGTDKALEKGYFVGNKELAFGGYVIIQAGSDDQAVEITKGCPTFELNGTIEIREITAM